MDLDRSRQRKHGSYERGVENQIIWSDPVVSVWVPSLQTVLSRFKRQEFISNQQHHIMTIGQTFEFLQAGGSLVRVGDGEAYIMVMSLFMEPLFVSNPVLCCTSYSRTVHFIQCTSGVLTAC